MPRWRLTIWCFQRKFPLSFERFALLEDKGFPKCAICSGIQTSRQLLYAGCIHCNSYRWLLGQVLHHIYKESTDEVESIRLQRIALELCITLKESIHCWSESLCNGKYKQVQIKVLTFQCIAMFTADDGCRSPLAGRWRAEKTQGGETASCWINRVDQDFGRWINIKHSNEHLWMGC